jgi:hypothetical protein
MHEKITQAETILQWLTRVIDRKSRILNEPISTAKFIVRIKDGVVLEPELSIDVAKDINFSRN